MHIHFRGSMDFWDPALLNTLGAARPVIIFDQAGVGRSTGEIPTTFKEWADDLIVFVIALGIVEIDLLGFSMGADGRSHGAQADPETRSRCNVHFCTR
jgi:pimeloyl-ACP methyl ester carboxylesterase